MFTLERGFLGDVVAWNGSALAIGCVPNENHRCGQRIVLESSDALTWERVDLESGSDFGHGSLHRVGNRLFVVGYGYFGGYGGAKVWTSLDGHTWSRIRSKSFLGRSIDDMIKTPFGTFAVGDNAPVDSDNITGFILWPVDEAGSFGKPIDVDTNHEPPLVYGSAWTGQELLGWGSEFGPMGGGSTIFLASRDGRTWSELSRITSGKTTVVQGIVRLRDRMVAVGYIGKQYPLTPAAWTSDDNGRTWTRADVSGDDAQMRVVEVAGSGLIARGSTGWSSTERPASWESMDGTTWTRLADDEDEPLVDGLRTWARVEIAGRTCVLGSFSDGAPVTAAIYCR